MRLLHHAALLYSEPAGHSVGNDGTDEPLQAVLRTKRSSRIRADEPVAAPQDSTTPVLLPRINPSRTLLVTTLDRTIDKTAAG